MADSDKPAVPVALVSLARHPVGFDDPGQGESGFLAASPLGAAGGAFLLGFGRVDAIKASTLAGNFDGLAVDDAGLAGSGVGGGRRDRHKNDQDREGNPNTPPSPRKTQAECKVVVRQP